ncbi:MAG: FkbM family methyltransferase [Phycisphaerales bacterium]
MTAPPGKRSVLQSLRVQARCRSLFRGPGFLWWIYDRLLGRFPSLPLPFKRRTVAVRLRDLRGPLHVRLGTTDFRVLEEIFFEHEYDALFDGSLHNVRTIVDLGANVGLSIRLWQNRFPGAAIIAVEPDDANLAVARLNALAGATPSDPHGNASLVRACVVGTPRDVTLDRSHGEWAFRISDAHAPTDSMTIPGLTLPQVLQHAGIDADIDLLKCDIEGAEQEVFATCSPWLARVRHMVVELHAPYDLSRFLADIEHAGGGFHAQTLKQFPGVVVVLLRRTT